MEDQLCFFPCTVGYFSSGSGRRSFDKSHSSEKTFCPVATFEVNKFQMLVFASFNKSLCSSNCHNSIHDASFNLFIYCSQKKQSTTFQRRQFLGDCCPHSTLTVLSFNCRCSFLNFIIVDLGPSTAAYFPISNRSSSENFRYRPLFGLTSLNDLVTLAYSTIPKELSPNVGIHSESTKRR